MASEDSTAEDRHGGLGHGELLDHGYIMVVRGDKHKYQYTQLGREELSIPGWMPYNLSSEDADELVRRWYMEDRIDEEGLEKGLELVESHKAGVEL